MNRRSEIVVIWGLTFHLMIAPIRAATEPTKIVHDLQNAKSEAEMDQVVSEFTRKQLELVQEASDLLRTSKSPEVKVRACYLLGELRNARASGGLAENLLLKTEGPDYSRIPLWGRFPCQNALVKIGKPAELDLFKILSRPASDEVRFAVVKVLQQIEGWRGAVFVLEEAWEQAGTEERKYLDRALAEARKSLRN